MSKQYLKNEALHIKMATINILNINQTLLTSSNPKVLEFNFKHSLSSCVVSGFAFEPD